MFLGKGRPLALKCVGLIKANGIEAQKREFLVYDDKNALISKTISSVHAIRSYATDQTSKAVDADTKLQRPYRRSVLEEVLIKEEEQPRTTAQKGQLLLSILFPIKMFCCARKLPILASLPFSETNG